MTRTMPADEQTADRGCTFRALIVGIAGALCIGLGSTYNDLVIKSSRLATWNVTPAAIFLFFVIVAVINLGLRLIHPRLALRRGELAVVYVLILLGNTLTGRAFSGMVLPVITGAFYYATPENNWGEVIQPFLPAWPVAHGDEAIRALYEGGADAAAYWEAWLPPLLHWLSFGLALFLAMVCLMVIVRRQWVEHERLVYPMVQLPLAMIGDGRQGSLLKSGLMWLGFAIPFGAGSLNAFHSYFPSFPTIRFSLGHFSLLEGLSINLSVNPSMFGFSYFIPQNVSLGLTFFYVVNHLQALLYGVLGWQQREAAMGIYSTYTDANVVHQSMGAMIVLVLGTLWLGRRHLMAVGRKALGLDTSVSDADEILSYRAAILGTVASFLGMGVWLWQTGIPLPYVPVLLFGAFVIFMTITRVVAQGGLAAMYPPTNAPDFVISAVGASALGPKGMAGLALSYTWGVDTLILLMSACANGLKLITEVGLANRRRLFVGIVAVIVLTLAGSIGTTLYLSQQHGAINLQGAFFHAVGQYPYWFMERGIHHPEGPNTSGWINKGVGAAVMVALMLANHRWVWWPFHPVGYPVSCVFGPLFFSVFLAWIIKALILKYAGLGLFNRLKPLFLGFILGEAVVAGTWVVIDHFTGMHNNQLGVVMQ